MAKKDIRVDARGHVSLVGLRQDGDAVFYFGHRDPDGTLHLVPALLVPAVLKESSPEEGHLESERMRSVLETIRDYFPDAKEV